MSRYFNQKLVWSLLDATQELVYVPPPDRGAFSATNRNSMSVLANEGRTLSGISCSAFSANGIDLTTLTGTSYVVEFTVNTLNSFMTIGLVPASVVGTANASTFGGYRNDQTGKAWAVGDVLAIVRTATSFMFFQNAVLVASYSVQNSPSFFFAAANSSGNNQITCESELDLMLYTAHYQQYVGTDTLLGWPQAAVAADGFPSAPPAPAPAPTSTPAVFDSTRLASGTLSTDNKTLSATSGNGAAQVQGTIIYDGHNDLAYVAEFTVGALGSPMSIDMYTEPYDPSSTLQSAGYNFFVADGTYQIGYASYDFGTGVFTPATSGTSAAWAVGDKLGVIVCFTNGRQYTAFFRNGTFVNGAFFSSGYSTTLRTAGRLTAGSGGANLRVSGDKTAATYASAYASFVAAGLTDGYVIHHPTLLSWPAADVQEALAQNILVQSPSTTAYSGQALSLVVGVDGRLTGTVTVTPHTTGAASFDPPVLYMDNYTRSVTITVTGATADTETITFTNDGGLTNAAGVSITVAPPPQQLTSGASPTTVAGNTAVTIFSVNVPSGATHLAVNGVDPSGQGDVYLSAVFPEYSNQYHGFATISSGTSGTMNVNNPAAGTWEIDVQGSDTFAGFQISAVVT